MNYPHPKNTRGLSINGGVPGGLHPTAGLELNWALDFMAPGGTRFLAPEACKITRLSGHNPAEGEVAPSIFGWNIYMRGVTSGVLYFVTHLGNRDVKVGQHVRAGDILGHVGHWPHDTGRSHSHIGVTSPKGAAASKAHICKIAKAQKIKGQWPAI